MTVRLTEALLEQLAERWRAQGALIATGQLRPGLSEREMDRLLEPLGLRLPEEARVWWGWHDGAIPSAKGGEMTVGRWTFSPLGAAIERTVRERGWVAPELTTSSLWRRSDPRTAEWTTGLLHWVGDIGGGQLAIDCHDPGPVSPVYYLDRDDRDDSTEPRTESIGDAVQQMIDGVDCGAVTFDHTINIWVADEALLRERMPHATLLR